MAKQNNTLKSNSGWFLKLVRDRVLCELLNLHAADELWFQLTVHLITWKTHNLQDIRDRSAGQIIAQSQRLSESSDTVVSCREWSDVLWFQLWLVPVCPSCTRYTLKCYFRIRLQLQPADMNPSKKDKKALSKVEFAVPPFVVKKIHTASRYKIVTKDWFYTMYSGTGDIVVSHIHMVSKSIYWLFYSI